MNPPKVTVLIPTYNRARFLGSAIDSVLGQSFSDFEVIVVDDGSTDATEAVIARIADPRVRVLRREHGGISAALNTGLHAARGAYIARNDSDDVWLPHLLATLVPVLDARPDVGLVYAACGGMYDDGTPSAARRGAPLRYPNDALGSLLYTDYTASIATLFRRSCLERVGPWDGTVDANEDWDMALRVARFYRLEYVDRVVAKIREHGNSRTSLKSPHFARRLDTRVLVLDKLFGAQDLSPHVLAMRPSAYRNVHIGAGLQWLSRRDRRNALASFGRAFAAGGNRATTLVRIAWCMSVWFVLSRHPLTARYVHRLVAAKRLRLHQAYGRLTDRPVEDALHVEPARPSAFEVHR